MHYIHLLYQYIRVGLLNEFQYRANFLVNFFQSILTIGMSLGGLAVVFQHTDVVGDWRPYELVGLVGVYYIMAGVIGAMIQPSMELFLQDVRQGTLDFVLTKPEDSQLLVSIRRVSIWGVITMVLGFLILGIGLTGVATVVTPLAIGGFVLALLAGGVIVYSFWLMHVSGRALAGGHLSAAVACHPHFSRADCLCGHRARRGGGGALDGERASWGIGPGPDHLCGGACLLVVWHPPLFRGIGLSNGCAEF
jgi:hypothetical protein